MTIADEINDRKKQLAVRVPEVMKKIDEAFKPLERKFTIDLQKIVSTSGSRKPKFIAIQKLTSELREITQEFTACKKGCSACCNQRVMLSQSEADAIGHSIKKPAVQLSPKYKIPDQNEFGSETPCTFLSDGACTIYDVRPFMCRNQVNLDKDNLLCGQENWDLGKSNSPKFTGVPMLGPGPVLDVYRAISGQDIVGDIRDFFPKNK